MALFMFWLAPPCCPGVIFSKFFNNILNQCLVDLSSFKHSEKVSSFSWSGRHWHKASHALEFKKNDLNKRIKMLKWAIFCNKKRQKRVYLLFLLRFCLTEKCPFIPSQYYTLPLAYPEWHAILKWIILK